MPRPTSQHPTDLEFEIMKILWRTGPTTVRAVRDEFAETRDLAYTSVMTVMGIMYDKGYVTRRKNKGTYVYKPKLAEDAAKKGMLSTLMDKAFEGSAVDLMMNLLDKEKLNPEELAQLRNLIYKKAKEKKK